MNEDDLKDLDDLKDIDDLKDLDDLDNLDSLSIEDRRSRGIIDDTAGAYLILKLVGVAVFLIITILFLKFTVTKLPSDSNSNDAISKLEPLKESLYNINWFNTYLDDNPGIEVSFGDNSITIGADYYLGESNLVGDSKGYKYYILADNEILESSYDHFILSLLDYENTSMNVYKKYVLYYNENVSEHYLTSNEVYSESSSEFSNPEMTESNSDNCNIRYYKRWI